MKRIISLVISIALMLLLAYNASEKEPCAGNVKMQPKIEDSSFNNDDELPINCSGLLTWHPFY